MKCYLQNTQNDVTHDVVKVLPTRDDQMMLPMEQS